MCWTKKFSFSRDPVILDLKLQLALMGTKRKKQISVINLNSQTVYLKKINGIKK